MRIMRFDFQTFEKYVNRWSGDQQQQQGGFLKSPCGGNEACRMNETICR